MVCEKYTVAVYTNVFLTPSMTFIFRQLTSLPSNWESFVITRNRENTLLFPYPEVYTFARTPFERAITRLARKLRWRYVVLGWTSARRLISVIRRRKPSLIHAHFGPDALEILPMAKALHIPMITTFHGFDASRLIRDGTYRAQLKELFNYSFVLAVSDTMRRELISIGADEERSACAYIGVPLEQFSYVLRTPIGDKSQARQTVRFLQVSNFVEKKGHRYTLAAFAKLLEIYPRARLIFAGDGPLRETMVQFAASLGIEGAVEFLGHQNTREVIELMKGADCFLHHSVTSSVGDKEGIPTVIMEAMATGLPVIATDHAGIPELIKHNHNGYLVAEFDLTEYASCMQDVLSDTGIMGRYARATIEEKFNMAIQNQILARLYEKIVGADH